MKNFISAMFALFLLVVSAAPVSAAPTCSAGMIKNTYGFVATGHINEDTCAYTGWFRFKDDGTVQADVERSCEGFRVSIGAGEGIYHVRPNSCSVAASLTFPSDGLSQELEIMIVSGGKELLFMASQFEANTTYSGTAKPR